MVNESAQITDRMSQLASIISPDSTDPVNNHIVMQIIVVLLWVFISINLKRNELNSQTLRISGN